ncbi:MAG: hypothetical protein ACJ748_05195, partial [Flavisolibacter sp.]
NSLDLRNKIEFSKEKVIETENEFFQANAKRKNDYDHLYFNSLLKNYNDLLEKFNRSPYQLNKEILINAEQYTYKAYFLVAETRQTSFKVVIASIPDGAHFEASCPGFATISDNATYTVNFTYGHWTIVTTLNNKQLKGYFDGSMNKKDEIEFDFTNNKVINH